MSQASNGAVDLKTVYQGELEYIRARRRKDNANSKAEPVEKNLIGLALSGGGIRSATTNLGILQALSEMHILPMVDYLSTVSGGGYIGSCLSALLSVNRGSVEDPGKLKQFHFKNRNDALFSTKWEDFPFRDGPEEKYDRLTGKNQVKHLRTHGNFLMARHGIFARETLRSIGNVLTGLIYHFLIVLLVLFSVSALYMGFIRFLAPGLDEIMKLPAVSEVVTTTKIVTPGPTDTETSVITEKNHPTLWKQLKKNGQRLLSSVNNLGSEPLPFSIAFVLGVLIAAAGFVILIFFYEREPSRTERDIRRGESDEDVFERKLLWKVGVFTLLAVLGVVLGIRILWKSSPDPILWLFLPFAVFLGARFGTVVCHLFPPRFSELWKRGFRSLLGSFQAMTTYGLLCSLGLALLVPVIYAMAEHGTTASIGEIIGAAVSLVGSRLLATRLTTAPAGKRALPLAFKKFLLAVFVGLFMLLLVILFSSILVRAYGSMSGALIWAGAGLVAIMILGCLVNYNKIALHYFYRDRLIETYLRTEVDDGEGRMRVRHDTMEMPLTYLHGTAAPDGNDKPKQWSEKQRIWGCTAPYHLISAAINLAGSRDLTRKDRKSGYFLFSKLYCGSPQTGYRRTEQYRDSETKLARALTISGAAAASAMGYYTFFAQAFAMTLFNLRLGYWLENPADSKSLTGQEGGVFWPWWLRKEMFSDTRASDRLVNLSDGGHTGDNVGIYPLLQRGCKIIIACDAEADGDLMFGSFTEALRHAYIDMGIDVDIDLAMIRNDPQTGHSRSHCAIGRIRYPDRRHQKSWLIYLKSSLTGDEPEPVLNYKRGHLTFPHETTADQFFDDSQFESYRALGVHIAEQSFEPLVSSKCFRSLQTKHSPFVQVPNPEHRVEEDDVWLHLQFSHSPFKAADHVETQRATDALKDLERILLSEEALREYYEECYRDSPAEASRIDRPLPFKVAQACAIQARLMEQVFLTLGLDRYANAPDNRGWMNLFRRWGNSPTFNSQFKNFKATCSPNFIDFYNQYVEKWSPIYRPIPHPWDPRPERTHNERVIKGIFLDPGRTTAEVEEGKESAVGLES